MNVCSSISVVINKHRCSTVGTSSWTILWMKWEASIEWFISTGLEPKGIPSILDTNIGDKLKLNPFSRVIVADLVSIWLISQTKIWLILLEHLKSRIEPKPIVLIIFFFSGDSCAIAFMNMETWSVFLVWKKRMKISNNLLKNVCNVWKLKMFHKVWSNLKSFTLMHWSIFGMTISLFRSRGIHLRQMKIV